jgi:flagellar hook-length control protein FliK
LLPLLQEALDSAVVKGMSAEKLLDTVASLDPGNEQLLDKLSASLEALKPGEVDQVGRSLAALIQQLDSQLSVTTGNLSAAGALLSLPGITDPVTQQGPMAGLVQQQLGPQMPGTQQMPNASDAAVLKQSSSELLPQASQAGLDKSSDHVQQQAQLSEGRQSDLALLMAAFRRQSGDQAQRTDNARPDILAVAGANSATVATTGGVPSSVLPTASIQTPVGQANWDQALGERIQWMVGQKLQGAQVKLSPANLGPMEVRIQVQNDQASVQFTAPHAMVRDALEAALPRLREMFEASGVELVDVDVSGHSFAEQKATGEQEGGNHWGEGVADADTPSEMVLESDVAPLVNAGRLDLFV